MAEKQLSTAEAELYDRQIRLWGIESQEKLRAANVLLIGVGALGSEIAKNILLSGINSLTIQDERSLTEDDIAHNFLLKHDSKIGNKLAEEVLLKAQSLNPLVNIHADTTPISEKNADYFQTFTIIVATGINFEIILKIDGIARENNIKFIYGDVFGMFGFSVADLQEHDYFEDRVQLTGDRKRTHTGEKKTVRVKGLVSYPPLNKVLVLPISEEKSSLKKISRPNPLLALMLTLIELRRRHNRKPDFNKQEKEIETLKSIAEEIVELYKFSNIDINDMFDLVFGEVAPVCAIVGGVIAQEVIKAVSHKEVPINNVFLFDPITHGGNEFKLNIEA